MDEYDKRIVFELMDNSRQTLRHLAKKIGLTAPSIKKRIDRLTKVGFIKDYIVTLGHKYITAETAMIIAKTDGSVDLDRFTDCLQNERAVFLILPIVSGEILLRAMFTTQDELSNLTKKITDFEGVENVDIHVTEVYESECELTDFTTPQLKILSQLVRDPRLPIHEIAARAGLSVKSVEQNLETLVREDMVLFGIKWNPFGKGTSVVAAPVRYNPDRTTPVAIVQWFNTNYPIEFWYSRTSMHEPLLFAILGMSDITKLDELTRDLQKQEGIESVTVMIGYSSVNPDTLSHTMLIDLLTAHDLWPPQDIRT
ncbi:MAG: winged helix-turn-helix transcriptional regulator [Candidatus Thorarchaeota archaeon]